MNVSKKINPTLKVDIYSKELNSDEYFCVSK